MKRSILLAFSLVLIITSSFYAQVSYDKSDFRSPLGIDLLLAGNFAEMRSNHFHTGLDIKTRGKEGYRIYAIDSGYVSRINVSHYGYGNALYITHPNGYTSVYAHLSTFPKGIMDYIRKKQYSKKSETIQVYPGRSELIVSKGEVVAYSGNSGSSSAPHLHFEIRETETERPVNPLLFDFAVKDTKKPDLLDVKVYPLEGGYVNGKKKPYNMDLEGTNGIFSRAYDIPVKFKGKIGLAINTIDYLDGASNKCGIYNIKLYQDDQLIFEQELEKLEFSKNRYINTHSDYLEYRKNKQSYHKSFVAENNRLDIYKKLDSNGRIWVKDTLVHSFKYVVEDVYGNQSVANFTLKSEGYSGEEDETLIGDNVLDASSENTISKDGFIAEMDKHTVYEDLKYLYKQEVKSEGLADIHTFHNDYIPLQKYFVLKLKMKNIPKGLEDKALIVELSRNKKITYAKGGETDGNWIQTEVRSFGNYTVKLDTAAPVLEPINISEGKSITQENTIMFSVSDNLSGLEEYHVYIDDEWKLAFYDRKKKTVTLRFDEYTTIEKGNHKVKIVVADERKNQSSLEYGFVFK